MSDYTLGRLIGILLYAVVVLAFVAWARRAR